MRRGSRRLQEHLDDLAQRARDAVALFRTRFKREPHEFPLLSLDLSKAHQPCTEVG